MVALNVLSRRSLLKASSFLVASAAVAPAAALAAPTVPEVLAVLLSEYRDAAADARQAHTRFNNAHREKGRALEAARIYVPFVDGQWLRLGETGNANHPATVAILLEKARAKALSLAGADKDASSRIKSQFRALRRSLARKRNEYERIVVQSGFREACDNESAASRRFEDADKSLGAYQPVTVAEVASIVAVVGQVGPFVGHCHGLSMSDLSAMLNPELAVA